MIRTCAPGPPSPISNSVTVPAPSGRSETPARRKRSSRVATAAAPSRPAAGIVTSWTPGIAGSAGTALVAVEAVIGLDGVLVDRLLDEADAERPRVEADVAGGVTADRGHVVDAGDLDVHRSAPL